MDRRFITFLVVAFGLLMGYQLLLGALGLGPKPAQQQAAKDDPAANEKPAADAEKAPAQAEEAPAEPVQAEVVEVKADWPEQRVTLGSLDPASPYQMLVTVYSAGAAVERIELNNPRFGDLPQFDDVVLRGGYIGHLAPTAGDTAGALIGAVGAGTPAAAAGLQPGDVITRLGETPVTNPAELQTALERTEAGRAVEVQYRRAGDGATAKVTPIRHPLSIVRPEQREAEQDPMSFLFDVSKVDGKAAGGEDARTTHWELAASSPTMAEFRLALPSGLVMHKRFELVAVEDKATNDPRGYELKFQVAVENPSDQEHKIVYQLGGPTGLPTEGWWYGSKLSPEWFSAAGIRDVVAQFYVSDRPTFRLRSAVSIAKEDDAETAADFLPLIYAGVDAQYFATVLTPQRELDEQQRLANPPTDPWFKQCDVMRVGPVPTDTKWRKAVNTSFRLTSQELPVKAGETLKHDFQIFAGPKSPDVLPLYGPTASGGLDDLLQFGWFGWVARPMSRVLQFFYAIIPNYGIAIILLTVLVRSCMFPISRKQALGAQKMQMLQPEIKKIAEKYKANPEQRMKAQQDLFRKHNYNPLAGCLPLFLQLPIFIGLYRSLMVNVELRQAPLIPGVAWCSDLAAPDMLYNWSGWMPGFIQGFLGPFLNVLPLVTVGLFLWQQKLFMPPPTDEQSRLQQKMMQYMMIFMAFMFYHVAAGLCIYFIASSLWGIAERKLLPKTLPPSTTLATLPATDSDSGGNGQTMKTISSFFKNGKEEAPENVAKRRKERGKRK
jgi:YidC/Oxa1 family membrane protein insertase